MTPTRRHALNAVLASALAPLVLAAAPGLAFAGEHGGGGEQKKKGGGESYLQFPALTATIVRATGHRGVLSVESGLDVPDAKLRDVAMASQPRLRDAYIRFLQIYAAGLGGGALPNTEVISAALQRSTDQVLGRPGARLLLGAVIVN